MIRDVGVWPRVLTSGELNQIRTGDITGTNPVGFWRLNEGTGTTVSSSGQTTINGTLQNGLGWINWSSHVVAVEGETLTFTLGNLPAVSELGVRSVLWTASPASFVVVPTNDPEMYRIRILADGVYTINATITDGLNTGSPIAPVVTTASSNSVFAVSNTDLIATRVPTITNGTIQSFEGGSTNPLTLTDGTFGLARTSLPYPDAVTITPNLTLTYSLDTVTFPGGFDLTGIETYTGWRDSGRDNQNYIVRYSTVQNPTTFIDLATVNFVPAVNSPTSGKVSLGGGLLAVNVAAVQFQFTTVENGYVGYRELDVFGVPSSTFVRIADRALVTAVNTAATIVADDVAGSESVPVTITASVTDPGITDTHTYVIQWSDGSANSSGSVVAGALSVTKTFAQDGNYTGTLTVTDNAGASRTKIINIAIANTAPVANNDSGAALTTSENSLLTIAPANLTGNDTDAGTQDVLSIASVSGISASGASVVLNANGSVSYDPNSSTSLNALRLGQSLVDTFTYVVTDNAGGTSSATVSITVNGQNDLRLLSTIEAQFSKTRLPQLWTSTVWMIESI